MPYLLLGLFGFLGLHSIRMVAPGWRASAIRRWGEGTWKAAYSLLSIGFFVLLIWGYAQARQEPVLLWSSPRGLRHLAAPLVLLAFVLLIAAYLPRNHIKARLGHPMLLAVKLWAFAHLLVSGWLHSVVLFGAFLLWSVVLFREARRRPSAGPVPAPNLPMTLLTVVIGVAAWAAFGLYLHPRWIGVAPF